MPKKCQDDDPSSVRIPSAIAMRVDTKFTKRHVAEVDIQLLCGCPGCDDELSSMIADSDNVGIGEDRDE